MAKDIKFEFGGMWEDREWLIRENCKLNRSYSPPPCQHCVKVTLRSYVCPKVVVAVNEGGYNSTGVCLNCIIDAAKELNLCA
jgi:hypothetical protein